MNICIRAESSQTKGKPTSYPIEQRQSD